MWKNGIKNGDCGKDWVQAGEKLTDTAIKHFTRVIELEPGFAAVWSNRGAAQKLRGNFIQSESDYTRALELAPTFWQGYFNRCRVRLELNDRNGALRDCERAYELKPDDVDVLFELGSARFENQQFEEAVEAYSAALELDPLSPQILYGRVEARFMARNLDEVLTDLDALDSIKPNYRDAQAFRGMTLYWMGRQDEAKEHLGLWQYINADDTSEFAKIVHLMIEGQLRITGSSVQREGNNFDGQTPEQIQHILAHTITPEHLAATVIIGSSFSFRWLRNSSPLGRNIMLLPSHDIGLAIPEERAKILSRQDAGDLNRHSAFREAIDQLAGGTLRHASADERRLVWGLLAQDLGDDPVYVVDSEHGRLVVYLEEGTRVRFVDDVDGYQYLLPNEKTGDKETRIDLLPHVSKLFQQPLYLGQPLKDLKTALPQVSKKNEIVYKFKNPGDGPVKSITFYVKEGMIVAFRIFYHAFIPSQVKEFEEDTTKRFGQEVVVIEGNDGNLYRVWRRGEVIISGRYEYRLVMYILDLTIFAKASQ